MYMNICICEHSEYLKMAGRPQPVCSTRTITFSPITTDPFCCFQMTGRARGGDYGKGEGSCCLTYAFLLTAFFTSLIEKSTLFTKCFWKILEGQKQQKAGEGQILDSGIM